MAIRPFQRSLIGNGARVYEEVARQDLEGVVSESIVAYYKPSNRGIWVKAEALNRQEFVVVGWTDPEGSHPALGSLLIVHCRDDGKLIYAGPAGRA